MKRLNDIHRVNEAEIQLIQEESALLLQKRSSGFNGELKSSRTIIENYVKGLLQKHLPGGYRICSGYIATTESIVSEKNFIQHDIIIVDGRLPSLHSFGISDIEVVPAEAVCGIIEVKRTLTEAAFKSAVEHIKNTKNILEEYRDGVKSKSRSANNAAGPTFNSASHAPFYAIVALHSSESEFGLKFIEKEVIPFIHEFVDFIWVPAASLLVRFCIRSKEGECYFPLTVSRNQEHQVDCLCDWFDLNRQAQVYGTAISCYRTWINSTSGLMLGFEENTKYFGVI